MEPQQKISPCLWFENKAQEAAEFYVSVFPESRIDHIMRSGIDWPAGKAGDVILVEFTLSGVAHQALNGGAGEAFNNAVSLSVSCKDQAEVDRIWGALIANGGEPIQCGWLKDKYGET
ncbi:VOC family protein [Falsihalocynthiibacter sp. BN13B15]|uniref:VOC family protein n=1 Tax=Falsihalocynthiibacter sp. BN13B15 TaxID=3240871 RepID=UPI00350F611D